MKLKKNLGWLVLMACFGLFSVAAQAQWVWKNERGQKEYSDRPPPTHIPQKNIIKSPRGGVDGQAARNRSQQPVGLVDRAQQDGSEASADGESVADNGEQSTDSALDKKVAAKEAQEKKAREKQEAAEEAKREAENQERKARNCKRIAEAKRSLSSGRRIATTDANGERKFLSDDEVKKRLDDINQSAKKNDC